MGGKAINYKKMDAMIRQGKSWEYIKKNLCCSKSSVVKRARELGLQRKKTGRPRVAVEPREKSFDYLAHLRSPVPDMRPLEGLSSYVQGVHEELDTVIFQRTPSRRAIP